MAGLSQNMEKHKEEKYKQNIRHETEETVYGGECGLVFPITSTACGVGCKERRMGYNDCYC